MFFLHRIRRTVSFQIIVGLTCLFILLLHGWSTTAQIPDKDPDTARWDLWFDRTGTLQTSLQFTLPKAITSPDLLKQGMARSLGCPSINFNLQVYETWLVLSGRCPHLLHRHGWTLDGSIDLQPMMQPLRIVGIEQLRIKLNHPNIGFYGLKPAIAPSTITRDRITYTLTEPVAPAALNALHLQFGYRVGDALHLIAPVVGVLVLPVLFVLILRRWALVVSPQPGATHEIREKKPSNDLEDTAPVWFSYLRGMNWAVIGLWVLWTGITLRTGIGQFLNFVTAGVVAVPPLLLSGGLFILPPIAIVALCYVLSHPVYRQVGDLQWTRMDLLQQALWSQIRVFAPLLLLAVGAHYLIGGELYQGVLWLLAAYLLQQGATYLLQRANDVAAHALTVGELRDRIFALAKPAGVHLQQIYILPVKRGRVANAFAVQGGNVLLTDYLLQQLHKREVDAVVAHELAHLQRGHPQALQRLVMGFVLLWGAIASLLSLWFPEFPWVPVGIVLTLLVFYAASRRFEQEADMQAALLTNDPAAVITSLMKITRLNQLPLQWSHWDEQLMTHPSLNKRIAAIAHRYDIPPDRLQDLLNKPSDQSDYYPLPTTVTSQPPIFSSLVKQGMVRRSSLAILAALVIPPALIARLVQPHWAEGVQLGVYLAGAIATLALCLLLLNHAPTWGFAAMGNRLQQKLQQTGIDPTAWKGIYVGFAPDDRPRNYEGFGSWDIGFLFQVGDRLCYVGEQTQFALSAHQIQSIELGRGAPGWWRSRQVYIQWQAGDRTGIFNICPAGVHSLEHAHRAAHQLAHQLQSWQVNPLDEPIPAPWSELPLLEVGNVTSRAISESITLDRICSYLSTVLLLAFVVSVLLQLPFNSRGLGYVALVASLGAIVQMLPYGFMVTLPAKMRSSVLP